MVRISRISCVIASVLFSQVLFAVTPVELTFKISGPTGPLSDFYLWARYRNTQKLVSPLYAKTNLAGEAVFQLDRDIAAEIEIHVGDPSDQKDDPSDADIAASQAFGLVRSHLGLPPRWLVRLPEGAATVQRIVDVPSGRTIRVMIPAPLASPLRLATLGVAGSLGGWCSTDKATRILSRTGVPGDQPSTGYFTFDESDIHSRSIPIQIPAGPGDVELPEIVIAPVAYTAFVIVDEVDDTRLAPEAAFEGLGVPGVTLFSADGQIIVSAIAVNTQPIKVPVPAGTYFYAPGCMGPENFQAKLAHRLAAGVDLSALFPHVTVSSGETKTLQVNAIDVINGIISLP